jgi:hypothetical protein
VLKFGPMPPADLMHKQRRVRKGGDSASRDTPLNDIIKRLAELGLPRFRFSCREADWLQAVDQSTLRTAPGGSLELLHLDALNDQEVIDSA